MARSRRLTWSLNHAVILSLSRVEWPGQAPGHSVSGSYGHPPDGLRPILPIDLSARSRLAIEVVPPFLDVTSCIRFNGVRTITNGARSRCSRRKPAEFGCRGSHHERERERAADRITESTRRAWSGSWRCTGWEGWRRDRHSPCRCDRSGPGWRGSCSSSDSFMGSSTSVPPD